jgi:hypothetical protein
MNSRLFVILWTQAKIKNKSNPKNKFTGIRMELYVSSRATLEETTNLTWAATFFRKQNKLN